MVKGPNLIWNGAYEFECSIRAKKNPSFEFILETFGAYIYLQRGGKLRVGSIKK